jgi:CubicO group peptidase (beta-lactamase class C family)
VRDGRVDIDRPMGNPRWPDGDARNAITWRQWITMVDGLDYQEIEVDDPTKSDAVKMLYGAGHLDVAACAAALPLVRRPGTHWNYNTAGFDLVCDALGRVFAPAASPTERRARVAEVLSRELFARIGMTSAQPQFDAAGTFIGGSSVYATARDFARFGLLYLRDGVWDGKRILPAGWVDFARSKHAPDADMYGAGFWISPAEGTGKPYHAFAQPGAPRDLFVAQGHEGQVTVTVPSKDLVLVRLGLLDDAVGWPALGSWANDVVALFPG